MKRQAGMINTIAYEWNSHFRQGRVKVVLESKTGMCCFYIVNSPTEINFFSLFPEVDAENGVHIHEAYAGKPVQMWFGDDGKLRGLSSFLDEDGDKIIAV